MPNWAEVVTAIATVVLAVGAVGAIGAAIFAGQQVREARIGRQAEVAAEFFRRWSDDEMVTTRRLVASYRTPDALRDALLGHLAANDVEATSCSASRTTSSSWAPWSSTAGSISSWSACSSVVA
jgi:hypothetical protein